MITIGYSTRTENPKFMEYLKTSCGIKENLEIIEKINNGSQSLTKIYNEIISESKNDIVILCHDDIYFEKNYWGKRILEHFEKTNHGILGVAGTSFLDKSGQWWKNPSEMIGQVYHEHQGKKWLSEYSPSTGSKITNTILVDGLFMVLHKKRIKKPFNEEFQGFHFYDVTFCFENFLEGVDIGVLSNVPITHKSIGMTNKSWDDNRILFKEKYKDNLPVLLPNRLPILKNNEKLPLVSIIIPIYNYGSMFNKTINSVFNSNYPNLEIIIVNDGSEDDYVNLKLSDLKNHPNVKVIYQKNMGPSAARNNGIRNSNGQYILPLDADDLIHPDYIQTCVSIIKNNPKISPVYCDTQHVGEIQGIEIRPEWSIDRLKQGPFIVNCSMFSRESFETCNGYDENLKGWEDYDLWIRMAINGYIGKRIPKPLFTYFHHEKDGTVSTLANNNQVELYKKIMSKNFVEYEFK